MASDLTVDLSVGTVNVAKNITRRPGNHLIDTGLETLTGGRVRRLAPLLGGGTFMLTYGDGVSDVPLDRLLQPFTRAMESSRPLPRSRRWLASATSSSRVIGSPTLPRNA